MTAVGRASAAPYKRVHTVCCDSWCQRVDIDSTPGNNNRAGQALTLLVLRPAALHLILLIQRQRLAGRQLLLRWVSISASIGQRQRVPWAWRVKLWQAGQPRASCALPHCPLPSPAAPGPASSCGTAPRAPSGRAPAAPAARGSPGWRWPAWPPTPRAACRRCSPLLPPAAGDALLRCSKLGCSTSAVLGPLDDNGLAGRQSGFASRRPGVPWPNAGVGCSTQALDVKSKWLLACLPFRSAA